MKKTQLESVLGCLIIWGENLGVKIFLNCGLIEHVGGICGYQYTVSRDITDVI